jgi:hypothetical protein
MTGNLSVIWIREGLPNNTGIIRKRDGASEDLSLSFLRSRQPVAFLVKGLRNHRS